MTKLTNSDLLKNEYKALAQIFEEAEKTDTSNFTRQEWDDFQLRLKGPRDYKNVLDYAFEQGKKAALRERKMEIAKKREIAIQIAKMMKMAGETVEKIKKYTELTNEEIDKL